MNLVDALLKESQGSGLVSQLSRQAGLDQDQVKAIIGELLPALSGGIRNNISNQGLDGLVKALQTGNHDRYLDNPETLSNENAVADGNSILGHILGSKDVSRNVAKQTSEATGADEGVIKKLLPLVAAGVMGALSKQTNASANMSNLATGSPGNDLSGILTSLLDRNQDGNVADDLFNLAKKFF